MEATDRPTPDDGSARDDAPTQAERMALVRAYQRQALARPDPLAANLGTTAAVVRTYEDLFYDVRRRRQNPDYIFNEVIGPRLRYGVTSWDAELVWKFFGYIGGVAVLDEILDTSRRSGRPVSAAEVAAFLAADTQAVVRLQTAVAARSLRVGEAGTDSTRLRGESRPLRGQEEEDSPKALLQHIDAFLKEVPWAIGAEGEKQTPAAMAAYDAGAMELRDEELMSLSRGEAASAELEALKDFRLPPPRPRAEKPGLLGGENALER